MEKIMGSIPYGITHRIPPLVWAVTIAGAYLLFGLLTIDDFGVTWDEPVHFDTSDYYVEKILNNGWYQFKASEFSHFMESYGPFFDILASVNNRLLAKKSGFMEDDNSRHLHLVILSSLTIFLTFLFAYRGYSTRSAVFSALFLASFPRFVGHSFNNPKDIPIAFIFVLCLYLFYRRMQTGKRAFSLFLALAGAIGFASRISYIIVPSIIVVYIMVSFVIHRSPHKQPQASVLSNLDVIAAIVASIPLGFLFWPYFWTEPFAKLLRLFDFFFAHSVQPRLSVLYAGAYYVPGETMPWHYAPFTLIITTPLVITGCFAVGILLLIAQLRTGVKEKDKGDFFLVLLLWIAMGLLPFMLPGQRVYGGIRHFLFIVPALCMLAGAGLDRVVSLFENRVGRQISTGLIIFLFGAHFVMVYSYHPFYTVYYNALVGGPSGAYGRFSLENWGNAYKRGCRWLNSEAPFGAKVLVLVAPQIPRYYLRPDIEILGPEQARFPPTHYDYSLYIIRDNDPLQDKRFEPVFTLTRKGQTILNIHKWGFRVHTNGRIIKGE